MNRKFLTLAAVFLIPNLAQAETQANFEAQSKLMDAYLDKVAKSVAAQKPPSRPVSCLGGLGGVAKPAALKLTACAVLNDGKTQYIQCVGGQEYDVIHLNRPQDR